MNQSERYITSGVFSHERPQETHVDVQELINVRERLREALAMFRIPATGCWCSDDPRIFDHSVRCQTVRAALNDQKGGE